MLAAAAFAHVPTYGYGASGCSSVVKSHRVSQVWYRRGTSGGLEIHVPNSSYPFDQAGKEQIDFDVVLKHRYDPSTYAVYVGCGGCIPEQDPIATERRPFTGYGPTELEVFTQSWYASFFPNKTARKFDSSELSSCTEKHFTVRVVDYHNRTTKGHEEMFYGVVVGLAEEFSIEEIVLFPSYILANHGSVWNDLGWTWPVILTLSFPAWWLTRYLDARWLNWLWVSPVDYHMTLYPRAYALDAAIAFFIAAALEQLVHLCYAQAHVETFGWSFFAGVILILTPTVLCVGITVWIFHLAYHRGEPGWWISGPWLWWAEILTGVSFLGLFGAGFYFGPAALVVSGLLRAAEWRGWSFMPGDVTLQQLVSASLECKGLGSAKAPTSRARMQRDLPPPPPRREYTELPNLLF